MFHEYCSDIEVDHEKLDEENESYRYELPEEYCPICQLKNASKEKVASFIENRFGVTIKQ